MEIVKALFIAGDGLSAMKEILEEKPVYVLPVRDLIKRYINYLEDTPMPDRILEKSRVYQYSHVTSIESVNIAVYVEKL